MDIQTELRAEFLFHQRLVQVLIQKQQFSSHAAHLLAASRMVPVSTRAAEIQNPIWALGLRSSPSRRMPQRPATISPHCKMG